MQEFNREANTICSKSIVTSTTFGAVELKVLIEQMREQIQNIEQLTDSEKRAHMRVFCSGLKPATILLLFRGSRQSANKYCLTAQLTLPCPR